MQSEKIAESKRFDPNKIENFSKNSADKTQTLRYWIAAVDHGKSRREIDESLYDDHDDKQIAELLSRIEETAQKLIEAVQ